MKMNKTYRQKIRRIVLTLRKEWLTKHHLIPLFINSGNCDSFAAEIEEQAHAIGITNGYAVWGEDEPDLFPAGHDPMGHCFYRLGNLFFDAECPSGVNSPHLLPFYKRNKKLIDLR